MVHNANELPALPACRQMPTQFNRHYEPVFFAAAAAAAIHGYFTTTDSLLHKQSKRRAFSSVNFSLSDDVYYLYANVEVA